MSRVGKKVHALPAGVTAEVRVNKLYVKGPKGELNLTIHPHVTVAIADGKVGVTVADENNKKDRSLWGTFSSLVENLIVGVSAGYKKSLEINGVGYKANMQGNDLNLEVGFSHPVLVAPPAGIKFSVEKNIINVEGIDKQAVGEIAAQIRAKKKVEPYKGKGIKYIDEVPRKKAGKTAAKS